MPGRTLVVLGSGPGIGVAVAQAFSVRGFTHIALVSRNAERLKEDQDKVLDSIQERGYSCQVKTWACDISDLNPLKKTLGEIGGYGELECVLFNAARVAGKPPLEEDVSAIEQDFRVSRGVAQERCEQGLTLHSSRISHCTRRHCGPFPSCNKSRLKTARRPSS